MSGIIQNDASISVLIQGLSLNDIKETPQTVYNVVGKSNRQTLYGHTHIGTHKNWNDTFVVNLQNLEYDDLDLVVFANDQQIGTGKLGFMEIVTTPRYAFHERVELRQNGLIVGYLEVQISKSKREQIVGGLRPPIISLINGATPPEELKAAGIEKVRATNLNFFSCMDAKDMGWEFYPYSFETKLKTTYGDH